MAVGLLILHSEDVHSKLSDWIKDLCLPDSTILDWTCVEKMPFPLRPSRIQRFSKYRAAVIVISRSFLNFLEAHSEEIFSVGRLLRPSSTIALLYGVGQEDVLCFHKAAFFSYDAWPKFVVHEWIFNLPQSVVRKVNDLLSVEEVDNPQGKYLTNREEVLLTPKKVNKDDNRVYLILYHLLSNIEKINILLECKIMREVVVEKVNPYVIYFDIPDEFLDLSDTLNVLIHYETILLAVKQLECESKRDPSDPTIPCTLSVSTSSSSVDSMTPYDVTMFPSKLRNTSPENKPYVDQVVPQDTVDLPTEDETEDQDHNLWPSFLELCTKYGVDELTLDSFIDASSQMFKKSRMNKSPGSEMPPVEHQLHEEHGDLRRSMEDDTEVTLRNSVSPKEIRDDLKRRSFCPSHSSSSLKSVELHRSISWPSSLSTEEPKSPEENKDVGTDSYYMSMAGDGKRRMKSMMPHEKLLEESSNRRISEESCINSISEHIYVTMKFSEEAENANEVKKRLSRSQLELLELLEAFKRGAKTFSEVENLFEEWHQKHGCSIDETVQLRNPGRKISKPRKRQSFGLPDLIRMIAGKPKKKKDKRKAEEQEQQARSKTTQDCSATERHMKSQSKISCSSTSSGSSACSDSYPTGKSCDRRRDSWNYCDLNEDFRRKAQEDPSTKWFLSLSPSSAMTYCPLVHPGGPHQDFSLRDNCKDATIIQQFTYPKKSKFPKMPAKPPRRPRDPSPDYITPMHHKASSTNKHKDSGFLDSRPNPSGLQICLTPFNFTSEKKDPVKEANLRKASTPGIKYFKANSPQSNLYLIPDAPLRKRTEHGSLHDITGEPVNFRPSSCPVLSNKGTRSGREPTYMELLMYQEKLIHDITINASEEEKRDSIPTESPPPLPPPRR